MINNGFADAFRIVDITEEEIIIAFGKMNKEDESSVEINDSDVEVISQIRLSPKSAMNVAMSLFYACLDCQKTYDVDLGISLDNDENENKDE